MSVDPTEIVYDALNFDGLERRANYRTVAYRIDMLHIFDRKDAAAILYEIIYRWQFETRRSLVLQEIERRKKTGQTPLTPEEVEEMMWVYMSYNTFVRESGGAVGYNTVIRTLDYLVHDMKTLEQRDNHDPNFPDYEYRINKEVTRNLLKALPVQPAFTPKVPKKKAKSTQMGTPTDDSTQMGTPDKKGNQSTQMGTDSTQTGIASTQMGTEVYPFGGTSHTTHILHTHTSSQSNDSGVSASAPTPHVHFSQMENDVLYVQLSLVQQEQLDYGYDHLHIAGGSGACCQQCEIEAARYVIDDLTQEVKRITDKHKVVHVLTFPDDDPEKTVEDMRGKGRQPFAVLPDAIETPYPYSQNGYSTTSQAMPVVVNGATNQPQGDTHESDHDSRSSHRPLRPAHLTGAAGADDRQSVEATAHHHPNDWQADAASRPGRPDTARPDVVTQGDAADEPGVGHLPGPVRGTGDIVPALRPVGRVAMEPPVQDTLQAAAPALDARRDAAQTPPQEALVRSRSGETYATFADWQTARDAYGASLAALWETCEQAERKESYGNRFDRYRATMLRAWDAAHPRPKRAPQVPEPEMTPEQQARCQAWYQRFIDYRGYEWETGGQRINERRYVKLLILKYSDPQAAALHDYLFNRHFKWSKPDFRYKIGAYEVYSEAPSVIQILKAERNGGAGHAGNVTPLAAPVVTGYQNKSEELRREREKYAMRGK